MSADDSPRHKIAVFALSQMYIYHQAGMLRTGGGSRPEQHILGHT